MNQQGWGLPSGQGYGYPTHGQQGYGPPPHGYAPVGPREHPSANNALLLALVGNFCLGGITGIPAVLMGRSALRAIEREPQRWTGSGTANVAIVLGWISVFETTLVVTLALAHGYVSGAFGIVLGLAGLTLAILSSTDRVPALRPLRKARLPIGIPFAGILVGAAFGLLGAFGKDANAAQQCSDARAAYPVSLKNENFSTARENVTVIQRDCKASDDAAAMEREIESKAAIVTKRKAQEEQDRQAKVAAEKEKKAVETFPAKSKEISTSLKSAQSKAYGAKWEDSESDLDVAQSTLDDFKGTSVEQTKDYLGFTNQITTQRKAIQPQLDAIKTKRANQAAAAALIAAVRGPKPINSGWDGSISCIEAHLKDVMNDPDSYQHVATTLPVAEGEYWSATSSFRGKNAFGALILTTKKFYIQQNEVVKVE